MCRDRLGPAALALAQGPVLPCLSETPPGVIRPGRHAQLRFGRSDARAGETSQPSAGLRRRAPPDREAGRTTGRRSAWAFLYNMRHPRGCDASFPPGWRKKCRRLARPTSRVPPRGAKSARHRALRQLSFRPTRGTTRQVGMPDRGPGLTRTLTRRFTRRESA